MRLLAGLRYGENPHQPAAAYLDASLAEAGRGGIARAAQHHGKEVRRCRARLSLGQPPVCVGRGVVWEPKAAEGLHGWPLPVTCCSTVTTVPPSLKMQAVWRVHVMQRMAAALHLQQVPLLLTAMRIRVRVGLSPWGRAADVVQQLPGWRCGVWRRMRLPRPHLRGGQAHQPLRHRQPRRPAGGVPAGRARGPHFCVRRHRRLQQARSAAHPCPATPW